MKPIFTFFVLILFLFGVFSTTQGQEVKINTNMAVEADGTMRMDGAATTFTDLMVYPDATSRGSSKAPVWGGVSATAFKNNGSGSQGVFLWMFSGLSGTEQELYFTVQLPHGYKVGSSIFPHVHWTTAAGTLAALSGSPQGTNVVWGLEYSTIAIGGNFPNTTIITSNYIIPPITSLTGTAQHLITPLGTISGSGLSISTVLVCRLFRMVDNAADTFTNEAGLLGIDFHYEMDTQGSRTEYVK